MGVAQARVRSVRSPHDLTAGSVAGLRTNHRLLASGVIVYVVLPQFFLAMPMLAHSPRSSELAFTAALVFLFRRTSGTWFKAKDAPSVQLANADHVRK
jgi:hypothetical protein